MQNIHNTLLLNNNNIFSYSSGGVCRIWSSNGNELKKFFGHTRTVKATKLRNGNILTYSSDYTMRIWNEDGILLKLCKGHKEDIIGAIELSNGNIVSYSNNSLIIWDLYSEVNSDQEDKNIICQPLTIINEYSDNIIKCLELKGGDLLTYRKDNILQIYDLLNLTITIFSGHTEEIKGVIEFQNEQILSYTNNTIFLWSRSGILLQKIFNSFEIDAHFTQCTNGEVYVGKKLYHLYSRSIHISFETYAQEKEQLLKKNGEYGKYLQEINNIRKLDLNNMNSGSLFDFKDMNVHMLSIGELSQIQGELQGSDINYILKNTNDDLNKRNIFHNFFMTMINLIEHDINKNDIENVNNGMNLLNKTIPLEFLIENRQLKHLYEELLNKLNYLDNSQINEYKQLTQRCEDLLDKVTISQNHEFEQMEEDQFRHIMEQVINDGEEDIINNSTSKPSVLIDSILTNNVNKVKSCLLSSNINLNFVIDEELDQSEWETPLTKAVESGNLVMVELLIQNGADIETIDIEPNGTVLFDAVISKNIDMIKLLLKYGADINQEAAWGGSPYDYVKEDNLTEIIELFEFSENKVQIKSNYQDSLTTLLYIAKGLSIKYNNLEDIRIDELYHALHSVELSTEAEKVFRQKFGDENIDRLNKDTDGFELIEIAKNHLKIKYDENMKNLVAELKELFDDNKILNVREPFALINDIDDDEIPF